MLATVRADIIPLLHHLCLALQPFASSHNVSISFTPNITNFLIHYNAGQLIKGVSELVCVIISYLPDDSSINLKTSVCTISSVSFFKLHICNTGINLSKVAEITRNLHFPVYVDLSGPDETNFFINLPIKADTTNNIAQNELNKTVIKVPAFFQQVQRRLRWHFTKPDPEIGYLYDQHPKDSAFIKKLNEVIHLNINKENFDANALSKEMALSRTQLLRKLKPLTRQSPGCYIKSLRLQKAKELLENDDLSVSEVAYKTGFQTPSHFTKVFIQKFGMRPSVFRRPRPNVTNE